MLRPLLALIAAALLLAACGDDGEAPEDNAPKETATRSQTARPTATEGAGELSLSSEGFEEGQAIPERFTCEGDDLSPALSWSGVPNDAQSLALVMDDPDAPSGTFTHWLLYDLEPTVNRLPDGVETGERPGIGGVHGRNDGNRLGYTGPCPPAGQTHNYVFTLYALDAQLGLQPGAGDDDVHAAIDGHVLAEAAVTGTFGR